MRYSGPGGVGKTAFAQTLCRDSDVVDAFDGGVLWVSLANALGTMLAALAGASAPAGTTEETARKLAESVSGGRFLIVCDDAVDAEHLRLFPRMQQSCILLTTRFAAWRRNSMQTLQEAEVLAWLVDAFESGAVVLAGGELFRPERPPASWVEWATFVRSRLGLAAVGRRPPSGLGAAFFAAGFTHKRSRLLKTRTPIVHQDVYMVTSRCANYAHVG